MGRLHGRCARPSTVTSRVVGRRGSVRRHPCARGTWRTGKGPGWRFGKGGPRRMDQRTKAGLGVRAKQGRGDAGAMARSGCQGVKQHSD
jgi:hypothetical protein